MLYTGCSETPGEDPYLSGQYAINFVKGFQEHPEAPGEVMASACCKHYVANSMDGSTVDGHTATRVDFDAVISEQDLVDSYLAPFQACVEEGEGQRYRLQFARTLTCCATNTYCSFC